MKTCSVFRIFGILSFAIGFCGLVDRACSQQIIAPIFYTGGTRVSDRQTGQLIGDGYPAALYLGQPGQVDPYSFLQVGEPLTIVNGQLLAATRAAGLAGQTVIIYA